MAAPTDASHAAAFHATRSTCRKDSVAYATLAVLLLRYHGSYVTPRHKTPRHRPAMPRGTAVRGTSATAPTSWRTVAGSLAPAAPPGTSRGCLRAMITCRTAN